VLNDFVKPSRRHAGGDGLSLGGANPGFEGGDPAPGFVRRDNSKRQGGKAVALL